MVHDERLTVHGYETRDSSRVVAVHDTIMEMTTITVDRKENGDTVKMVQITDRTRAKSRDNIAAYRTERLVDTVFIERRDSVFGKTGPTGQSGGTTLHGTLKWVFWIVVALIALGVVLKLRT